MASPGTPAPGEWRTYDYVSPGLEVVRPDAAFPRMRAGDHLHHPWKHLRRDVPHTWYVDDRFPLMGFLNRDEAVLLHNLARQFAGLPVLEIGGWLGWSTCHLALAGALVDVIDPAHDDPEVRALVEASLGAAGVAERVRLAGGRSPESIASLAGERGRPWSMFFVDGDHERPGPARDVLACLPHAADDCAFVFHDLASPDVAEGLRAAAREGFEVVVYQTAQLMGLAWRGDVTPVAHVADPDVAWQVPAHLRDLPFAERRVARRPSARAAPAPPARELRSLVDGLAPAGGRPSVCIVTNEVLGLHKNGGIGTSMTGMAETLAGAGLRVTVLYTRQVWEPDLVVAPWRARYAELGIELVTLPLEDFASVAGPLRDHGFEASFLAYRYLSAHRFDVVHFNDCCGDGEISLAAKRLGLAFGRSLLVTALHGPSEWVLEHNRTAPSSLLLAAFAYAEHLSLRSTDLLWSPSRYMLDWARGHGFSLPEHTFLQQYSIPSARLVGGTAEAPPVDPGPVPPPREIVFFGRLEDRKGLVLFCNVVEALGATLAEHGVSVTFLGSPGTCWGRPALEYIRRRSSGWAGPVRTLTHLGQPEALRYLRAGGRLAVMASPADNSPCTVYEATRWGIPFLAARTGGIPELVHPDDAPHVLFEHTTDALGDALLRVVKEGGYVARPAVAPDEADRVLLALHDRWEEVRGPVPEPRSASVWAAVIVDHAPGADLDTTLASLAGCPLLRGVLVLDRAGDGARPGVATVDVLAEDRRELERELALLAGESVLLLHSGVTVLGGPLSGMLAALETPGVEGLLPTALEVDDEGRAHFVPPLGGSPAFSFYAGATFTGGLLVRRRALMDALRTGPLTPESPFLGLADVIVAGAREVWPYPEVVIHRRPGTAPPVPDATRGRVATYASAPDRDRYYMLAAGRWAGGSPSGNRQRATALVEMGLTSLVRGAALASRSAKTARRRLGGTAAGARIRRWRRR